jgi:hypothetical protein
MTTAVAAFELPGSLQNRLYWSVAGRGSPE